MTSSCKQQRSRRIAGYTLVELMVAGTLGAIVMAGVMSTFLMIGRSSVRVVNYSLMEKQTRLAFEEMGGDARMASNLASKWTGSVITGFTLTIPNSDFTAVTSVTYAYANSTFYVVPGTDPTATIGRRNLVTDVASLTFERFDKSSVLVPTGTVPDSTVKHIQVSVNVVRSGIGVAKATQVIRSTAFTIRNKST